MGHVDITSRDRSILGQASIHMDRSSPGELEGILPRLPQVMGIVVLLLGFLLEDGNAETRYVRNLIDE